jgi:hypothetical protein
MNNVATVPTSPQLLYDPDHALTKDVSTWPPAGRDIDLSSFWVASIAAADFTLGY